MRGMKKWLPFKSLSGQYEMLDEMKQKRKKQTKPELSSEEIDVINVALLSLKKGEPAKVTYFDDGDILSEKTIFIKLDGYLKRVFFKGFSVEFTNLLKLEKIR
ncbi:MAG: YolD-like family protein [Bacilli bacterium]|jgi:hypothetical protein|nr:YolD-like family protein [Bacilli bacterium]